MYQFLSYRDSLPYKKEISSFLDHIKEVVGNRYFDFSFNFTCGSSNNMVVYDDDDDEAHFDVDIVPYDPDQDYSPDEIRDIIFRIFKEYSWNYGYTLEKYSSDIELTFNDNYTCSFYIVYNFNEGNSHRQQYIKYDEDNSECCWVYRKLKYGDVNKKIKWLKANNLWDDYQDLYIKKIKENDDSDKPFKDIFLESLYQMCRTNGYDQNGNVQTKSKKAKYDFYYVEPSESDPIYDRIVALLEKVKKDISDEYTFQYQFIGSSARNMITADRKGNAGFDFDVNIIPQKIKCKNSPEHLRKVFFEAVQKIYTTYGFNSKPENSTSVITVKKVDRKKCKCLYGCDFAIVRTTKKGRQQNIVLRKNNNKQIYVWEDRGDYYAGLSERVEFLKKSSKRWNYLRKIYIEKKNMNYCEEKKSRAIYAESVKEACDKFGYTK